MPSKVYCNIEDHRLICDKKVIEDVTKVGLPTLKNKTINVDVAGMVMAVDVPDMTHFEAADFNIVHNNGVNCKYLHKPGKQVIEFRTVRQRYTVDKAALAHESVKFRLTGLHAETQKGDIENGSPFGSTEKYSLLRYEEEINGKVTIVVDAMAGVVKVNGTNYSNAVKNLLK